MALVYVRTTTTGATFSPEIELVSGATGSARWVCEETAEELTGLSPTFTWGTAEVRHVRLYVEVTPGGTDVLGEVVTWNTGFYDYNDSGRYNIGASYNKAPEAITAIENVNLMTGLVRFLSANTNLASHLDFTGCADLEYIECYYADVTGVTLTGCSSLIRLCLENCSCSTLDLNPVVSTLRDCRAAIQNTASLTFTSLAAALAVLYHFCVRDQVVYNIPPVAQFPAVEEFWIWNTAQSGHLVTGPAVTSLQAYSNDYTTADISASTHMETCMLYGCELISESVDGILMSLRDFGETPPPARSVNLTGNPGHPTANGVAAANELIADGWSVGIESESSAGVHVDNFNRPNGVPGNGWHGLLGGQGNSASGTIVSNQLQRLDNAAYQLYGNPGGGDLPADYTVYAIVPHATTTTYFGIFGRWAGGNGVRLLFTDSRTNITVGEAYDWSQNNVTLTTDAALPASWAVDQPHTIAMRMHGTLIQVYVDGVLVRHGTLALNASATGTEYGICGEGANRLWDEIGTRVDVAAMAAAAAGGPSASATADLRYVANVAAVAGGPTSAANVLLGVPITSNVAAVAGGPSASATAQSGANVSIGAAAVAGGPSASAVVSLDAAGSPVTSTVAAIAGGPIASAALVLDVPVQVSVSAVAGGPIASATVVLSVPIQASISAVAGGPSASAILGVPVTTTVAAVAGGPSASASVASAYVPGPPPARNTFYVGQRRLAKSATSEEVFRLDLARFLAAEGENIVVSEIISFTRSSGDVAIGTNARAPVIAENGTAIDFWLEGGTAITLSRFVLQFRLSNTERLQISFIVITMSSM